MNTQIKKVDMETEKQLNSIAEMYVDGFISKMFSDGILNDFSVNQLNEYLTNPDNYIRELENIAKYYYITSGEVFQLFDLAKVLPTLNYKIVSFIKNKNNEKNTLLCMKVLKKLKHKQLTRDLISQTISSGTLTGIWLGDKRKPYLHIFNRVDKAYPSHMINGEWVVVLDLSWLDDMSDKERACFIRNLSPYVTETMYQKYQENNTEETRLIELPQERTICLKTHTLQRNQQFGLNWALTGLYDLHHKKKLKDLEKAIANKLMTAIAVLTIGSENNENHSSMKLPKELKKKIHANVKTVLEKNLANGKVPVIALPEFANLSFPEMKSEALDPKKFESINSDVTSAYSYAKGLMDRLH